MLKWDEEYDKLCRKILSEGKEVENRTATNTIKIPSYNFELDIKEEFPILTTKKTFARQAILEMMWIYLVQSNDVRWLKDRKIKIWNEWEIDEKGYWVADQKIKQPDGTFVIQEVQKFFGPEWAHTIGTAYGYMTKKFQKTQKALDLLINHPESRRNVVTLWHDDYLATGVLEPCVWSHELDVTDGVLNMYVHQRSCDVPLGLPFNVTQYAALMHMYAQVAGLEVGKLSWSIKDAHIYVNQVEGIKEQMKNADAIRYIESCDKTKLEELRKYYGFRRKLGAILNIFFGMRFYIWITTKVSHTKSETGWVAVPSAIRYNREVFEKRMFTELTEASFNGVKFMIPKDY